MSDADPRQVAIHGSAIAHGSLYTMTSTIDSAGRIVIPKAIREAARLRPGTPVRFRLDSAGVLVEPEPLSVTFERRGTVVVAVPRTPVPVMSSDDVTRAMDEIRESYTDTGLDS